MNWETERIRAKVRLRFLRDRVLPLQRGFLGCPSRIDNFPTENMWDVYIRITKDHVKKDEILETEIIFLSSDIAEKYLKKGAKIILWEIGDFAEGEITELLY